MGMMAGSFPKDEWSSVGAFWRHYVPTYRSGSIRPFRARMPYQGIPRAARLIRGISARRSDNRIANYVDEGELSRLRIKLASSTKRPRDFSIRFGVKKPGHGYSGDRGDFCLVAGVYSNRTLTLFYRSIELIGGFAYDLVLIHEICNRLGIEPKFIEIWATKAFIFALKGNSNEKLYPKLQEIFREPYRIRTSNAGSRGKAMSGVPRKRSAR